MLTRIEGALPMMSIDVKMITLLLLMTLSVCAPLCAHDLVLVALDENTLFGDPGEYEPADLHRLVELNAFALGSEPGISLLDAKLEWKESDWLVRDLKRLMGSERVALVSGQYDSGYWVESGDGREVNMDNFDFPGAKNGGHYFKFGNGLTLAGGAEFKRLIGHRLEIVPQADPFTLKPNGGLAVQVLRRGKPLADAEVEISVGATNGKDAAHDRTGADGIAELPIRMSGLQIVAVDYKKAPLHSDLADHDDYSAALAFVLGERK